MPLNRAFVCMHGHCVDLDSNTFLAWVAENNGPRHAPGLRDDLARLAGETTDDLGEI